MKAVTTVCPDVHPMVRSRAADYLEIAKPRISLMVLITVATGVLLGAATTLDWMLLVHTLLGTALVATGASALNQLLEKDTDSLMRRTENRPLPAGRLHPLEVLCFGSLTAIVGLLYLFLALRQPTAALVAAFTFVSYVFIYTPLKRITTLNTLIGAVPGALPPVIGWSAVRGTIDPEIGVLFLILFLWQVPHFLAIAWIHRDDYARAGLQMLPVIDRPGTMTARQMIAYCLALVPTSLMPLLYGRAGLVYLVGALLLGLAFLGFALAFARRHTLARARGVLRASLLYLPILLALLLLEGVGR